MAKVVLTPDQVAEISGLVARYITEQHQRYAPHAARLSPQQKAAMDGFFSPQLLEGCRLLVLMDGRVPNPDFYPMLRGMGFTSLPDFSLMSAITFSDVVVSHRPVTDWLPEHRTGKTGKRGGEPRDRRSCR